MDMFVVTCYAATASEYTLCDSTAKHLGLMITFIFKGCSHRSGTLSILGAVSPEPWVQTKICIYY